MKQIAMSLYPNEDRRTVELPENIKQRVAKIMADLLIQMMKTQLEIAEATDERE